MKKRILPVLLLVMMMIVSLTPRTLKAATTSNVVLMSVSAKGDAQHSVPYVLKDASGTVLETYYTDEQGKIIIDLPDGNYSFEAGPGYVLASSPLKFTVSGKDLLLKATAINNVKATITNKDNNTPVVGMKFIMKRIDQPPIGQEYPSYIQETDSQGQLSFINVLPGNYDLVQYSDPMNPTPATGFVIPAVQKVVVLGSNPKEISLTAQVVQTVEVPIQLLEYTQSGSTANLKLANVNITITNMQTNAEMIVTTDANGQAKFTAEAGVSYLINQDQISGYNQPFQVMFPDGRNIDSVNLTNSKELPSLQSKDVTIRKVDEQGNIIVDPAQFKIYSDHFNGSNDVIILNGMNLYFQETLTTNNGSVTLPISSFNTYAVVESVAPTGYQKTTKITKISYQDSQTVYDIQNSKQVVSIDPHTFKIVDAISNQPLADVTYSIYESNPNGNVMIQGDYYFEIGQYTSDSQGILQGVGTFDTTKTYFMSIQSAPTGYPSPNTTPWVMFPFDPVDLSTSETIIPLAPDGAGKIAVQVFSFDPNGIVNLNDVTVEVYDSNNNLVTTMVTDSTGWAKSSNYLPNIMPTNPDVEVKSYTLKQVTKVDGYIKSVDISTNRYASMNQDGYLSYFMPNSPEGELFTINKVDTQNKPLPNARFVIYRHLNEPVNYHNEPRVMAFSYMDPPVVADPTIAYNNKIYKKYGEYTTDAQGQIPVSLPSKVAHINQLGGSNLVDAEYITFELKAPEGYQLDETIHPLVLSDKSLTVTNKPVETVNIEVTKNWVGGENLAPTRPAVQVQLYRDGQAYLDPQTIDPTTNKFTFTNLPKANQYLRDYTYTVEEVAVPTDYIKSATTYDANGNATITNTYTPGVKSHTINKIWVGGPVDKPVNIEVTLYQLDSAGNKVQVTGITNPVTLNVNMYTWNNLPKTDASGKEIEYIAEETKVDGIEVVDNKVGHYETKAEVFGNSTQITNTYVVNQKTIYAKKVWVGGDPNQHVQPTFVLYQNGLPYTKINPIVEKVADTSTEYLFKWENVEETDNFGQFYNYTIKEENVPSNYVVSEVMGSGTDTDPLLITNTYESSETIREVVVHKNWINLAKDDAPEKHTAEFILSANTIEVARKTITGNGIVRFENLPTKDAQGNLIIYSVVETPIKGFKSISAGNMDDGFVFANVPDNQAGVVIQKIDSKTKQVLANAKFTLYKKEAITPTPDPAAMSDIEAIRAELKTLTSNLDANSVTKVQAQIDAINQRLNNLEKVIPVSVVGAAQSGTDTVIGNYTTDANGLIVVGKLDLGEYYFVETEAPANYQIDSTPVSFVLTEDNIATPVVKTVTNDQSITQVKVRKEWVDQDATQRPAQIAITLSNGAKAILSKDNNWNHTFSNLPYLDAQGQVIDYKVTEDVVPTGYKVVYEKGVNELIIINVAEKKCETCQAPQPTKPVLMTVSGVKKWVNDSEAQRPTSVKIHLIDQLSNKVVQSTTASKASAWKYTFKDVVQVDTTGKKHTYRVEEVVPNGYTVSIDGFTITNTKQKVTTTPTKPTVSSKPGLPSTGDQTLDMVLLGSGFLLIGCLLVRKKKKN